MRSGTWRTTRPSRARFVARRSARWPSPEVDLVRSLGTGIREGDLHCTRRSWTSNPSRRRMPGTGRGRDVGCTGLEGANEPFDNGDAAVLTDCTKHSSPSFRSAVRRRGSTARRNSSCFKYASAASRFLSPASGRGVCAFGQPSVTDAWSRNGSLTPLCVQPNIGQFA